MVGFEAAVSIEVTVAIPIFSVSNTCVVGRELFIEREVSKKGEKRRKTKRLSVGCGSHQAGYDSL